jgi:hypothetical protein
MQSNDTMIGGSGPLVVACSICGNPFRIVPSRLKVTPNPTCSRACGGISSGRARNTRISRTCCVCGGSFEVKAYRVAAGVAMCCSPACAKIRGIGPKTVPISERFWPKINRHGPLPTHHPEYGPCWDWIGSISSNGYGSIGVGPHKTAVTHRVAWTLATGETLTRNDVIGHTCDRRPCVRNDDEGVYEVDGILLPRRGHLFKGTYRDNSHDMVAKGRGGRPKTTITVMG